MNQKCEKRVVLIKQLKTFVKTHTLNSIFREFVTNF